MFGGEGGGREKERDLNLFFEMRSFPSLTLSSGVDTCLWPPGRECVVLSLWHGRVTSV